MSHSSEWRTIRLDEVATLVGGGTPSRAVPEYFGGNIPWVTPTDLAPIGRVEILGSVSESITTTGLKASSAKLLPKGTVLFSSRASIGKIAITDRECATNQGFVSFVPETTKLESWFLGYSLLHRLPEIIKLCGETTFKEVPRGKLKVFEMEFPNLKEQRRIVARIQDCFSRLEEMEQLQSKALAQAEALTNRAIEQLWSEPEVASAPLVSLKQVADITTGNTPSRKVPAYFSQEGVPWITPGDMNTFKVVSAGRERLSELGIREGKARVVPANSVIVCCIGATIGKVAMVTEATGLNQQLNAVTFGKDVLPDFGYWACRALYPQIISNAAQSTLPILSKGKFETLEIPIPPKPVQKRVSEALDKVHLAATEMISEGNAVLESYQHLRSAILREAFSGRL